MNYFLLHDNIKKKRKEGIKDFYDFEASIGVGGFAEVFPAVHNKYLSTKYKSDSQV